MKNINFKLRLYFILSIIISILAFVLTVAYTQKYAISNSSVIWERYGIMLTLIGIPVSLKLFHIQVKKLNKSNFNEYLRKYHILYILRLLVLLVICFFNIVSLYITGSKNFYFLIIITIFAFFLCVPSKVQLQEEETNENTESK